MAKSPPDSAVGPIPGAGFISLGSSRVVTCVFLTAIVFLTFAPALRNNFTGYDDGEYVTGNPHVNTGLTRENVVWAFTTAHSSNWHPLTWLSHALDCALFGLNPSGHHFVNVLLHAANTVLLFLWLGGATGLVGRSVFVAAVFGLHPFHVESVAWVAERKDVLSTLFWMMTLLAYSAYVKRPGVARYVLVATLFAAGLLAKQMLVTVPLLLLLLDWWPLRRFDVTATARTKQLTGLAIEKIPLMALSALACAAVFWAQRQGGAVAALEQLPISLRLSNAAVSYVKYLWKTAWPVDLAVFYPFPMEGIPVWSVAASVLSIAAVSAAALIGGRKHPWLFSGWFWYLLTLLPVIGIVQVGMQSMADRYTYAPVIGILIAVTWGCCEALKGWRAGASALRVAASLALMACAALTWRQIRVWEDGLTLFTHTIAVTEGNFVAHNNLGVELDRRGRFEEALLHYREAARIKPGYRHGEGNYAQANFDKGERLFKEGNLDGALTVFREGLRYRPENASAHLYIGLILSQQRQLPAAIAEFRRAIDNDPKLARAYMGLGVAFAWTGRASEAQRAFEETLRQDPSNIEAHYDLGLTLSALGKDSEAMRHYDAAVKLKPDFGPAHLARAEALYMTGKYEESWRALMVARAAHAEVDPAFAAALSKRLGR